MEMSLELEREQVQESPASLKRCPCHNQGQGDLLPVGEFYRDISTTSGLRGMCKACTRDRRCAEYARDGSSVRDRWAATAHSARRRGLEFDLSFGEYSAIVARPCAYGGEGCSQVQIGIDRKDNAKGYIGTNCIPCCDKHNRIKSDVFTYDQMLDICALYPAVGKCGDAVRRKPRKHKPTTRIM
jgi:hypothetical protein